MWGERKDWAEMHLQKEMAYTGASCEVRHHLHSRNTHVRTLLSYRMPQSTGHYKIHNKPSGEEELWAKGLRNT